MQGYIGLMEKKIEYSGLKGLGSTYPDVCIWDLGKNNDITAFGQCMYVCSG